MDLPSPRVTQEEGKRGKDGKVFIEKLIDEIENEQLLTVLCTTDKLTLEMLVLRLRGYSSKEIAEGMRMTVNAVDLRLYKLRKKIKKFL